MENNKPTNEIQVELSEEMAQGTYANLAIISHSSSEFILDFIRVVPGAPKAKVKSRVILTPDNAKRLLFALQDNITKFEEQARGGKTAKFEDFVPPMGGIKGEA
ncbi:MAG: DUF3467 domain-containing protein [Parabacteroides sp.]|nr:DUF3467 domain-containing protein [Parabacteroides sp.]